MVSLKNKSKGFTIIELLIVIVVIAILATLVIVTFTGIQKKARDSQRQTDINAVTNHLEAFFAEKGYYPSLIDMQTPTFISTNMKGLDAAALSDPKGGTTGLAAATGASTYGYVTTGCTTTAVSSDTNQCTGFTITATLESGSTFEKKSSS